MSILLSRMTFDELKKKQALLVLERKKIILKLKDAKTIAKKVLLKRLQHTDANLEKVNTEILKRQRGIVKQGSKIVAPSIIKPTVPFQPSTASSFVPSISVIQPPLPTPVPMPNFSTYPAPELQLPAIVDETIVEQQEISNAELDTTDTDGFDFMSFLEENKFVVGAGVLIALYFVFGRGKSIRSNPRKKRKSKSSRKLRKNSQRRGYNRQ